MALAHIDTTVLTLLGSALVGSGSLDNIGQHLVARPS